MFPAKEPYICKLFVDVQNTHETRALSTNKNIVNNLLMCKLYMKHVHFPQIIYKYKALWREI